jgi:UDP-glucuronate 4-epimerase
MYASSSSVYGGNTTMPFSIDQNVDHPLNLYAATKKSNELMAHAYAHLFAIPTTGLRFFTVYGPWGRPDMAVWSFVKAAFEGQPIKLFNYGDMRRDFTYIDDIIEAMLRLRDHPPQKQQLAPGVAAGAGTSAAPWRVFNIGNSDPADLSDLVKFIEEAVGKKLKTELLPMQPEDVYETYADIDALDREIGFKPSTSLKAGIQRFVAWYRDQYGL